MKTLIRASTFTPRGGARWHADGPRRRVGGTDGLGLVEVLAALVIVSVGVLAVVGFGASVGAQNLESSVSTEEAIAARQVIDRVRSRGYSNLTGGTDTVTVHGRTYTVVRAVSPAGARVRLVRLTVTGPGDVRGHAFVTRLPAPRSGPVAP